MFTKSKKILYILTCCIFVFLVCCTFLSMHIAESLTPIVQVIKPVSMNLDVLGGSKSFNTVIPSAALQPLGENKYFVYVVRQRQGIFGIESYAKSIDVEVIASDGTYTAIDDLIVSSLDDVVISSSTGITSGETVKVTNI